MTEHPIRQQRLIGFDRLRIFAVICVIVLHASSTGWSQLSPASLGWQICNVYDSLVRFCVPVLFMLSGVFFLDSGRSYPLRKLFGHNILRLLTAYLFWDFAYAAILTFVIPTEPSWTAFRYDFLYGHYHLWFILALIGLYLAVPCLRHICEERRTEAYFLLLSFLAVFVLGALRLIPALTAWIDATLGKLHLEFFMGLTGYFVLGHYLKTYPLPPVWEIAVWVLGGLSVLVTIFGTAGLSLRDGVGNSTLYAYLLPNTGLTSAAVFLLFQRFGGRLPRRRSATDRIVRLSADTFGIYLVHDFYLILLREFGLSSDIVNPLISVPVITVLTFGLSLLTVRLLAKIPGARRYIL